MLFEATDRQDMLYLQYNKKLYADFFLRNADFFRNFTLFVQFACTDGVVYPNIVLKYKSE